VSKSVGLIRQLSQEERAAIQANWRVPVESEYPQKYWIACLDSSSLMPTEAELGQLRSFIEYKVRSFFNPTYQAKILDAPLAVDSGWNTIIFRKGAGETRETHDDNGWGYRRATWNHTYVPFRYKEDYKPLSLVEAMDRCETLVDDVYPKWASWKEDHGEIFAAEIEALKL
jgi:hypothetical protein